MAIVVVGKVGINPDHVMAVSMTASNTVCLTMVGELQLFFDPKEGEKVEDAASRITKVLNNAMPRIR